MNPFIRLTCAILLLAGLPDTAAWGATFTVTNTNDSGAGSLRAAIFDTNNSASADVITFDPTFFATAKTLALASALPAIEGDLTITGPAAGVTVDGVNQAFHIFSVGFSVNASFSGLTIRNGETGIWNGQGSATVTDTTLSDNSYSGIYNFLGTVVINNSTLSGNAFAIFNQIGTATVTRSTLSGSRDSGIYNTDGTVNAINCVLRDNGSGITNNYGTAAIINSTLSDNQNGIYNYEGQTSAINCTLAGNTNGINNAGFASIPTLILKNSLVVGNATNLAGHPFDPASSHNMTTGTAAGAGLDPGGLQNNGGPTPTVALLPDSPAIDAGENAHITGFTTDQRGEGFQRIIGQVVDIGAFEFSSPLIVTTDADRTGVGSLRHAIAYANSNPGHDAVTFDPIVFATARTVVLASALPPISGEVTITGPAAGVTVSGVNKSFAIFTVDPSGDATFDRMTITNGERGILSWNATATILNCTVSGNGQGIMGDLGTLIITGSTVRDNSDAGIYSFGCAANVTHSTVSGNGGEGLFIYYGPATVTNCTIVGNGTGIEFGPDEIYSSLVVTNSLVVGNTFNLTGIPFDEASSHNILTGTAAEAGLETSDGVNAVVLKDNGGPTSTIALLRGSPAIDAGENAYIIGFATDQRGEGFSRIIGEVVDIGAVEFLSPLVVTTDADSSNSTDDLISLRQAIVYANSNPGDHAVTFHPIVFAMPKTIALDSALPVLSGNLTITGPAAGVTVDGVDKSFTIFHVGQGASAAFSGLTIRNGGTGIYSSGTAVITNSIVSDNSGTGISAFGTTTFSDSTANDNGADGIYSQGTLHVINSTLKDNGRTNIFNTGGTAFITSSTMTGGSYGILNQPGTAIVTNSTLSGSYYGIYNSGTQFGSGSASVTNSTVSGNTLGIDNPSGTLILKNSLVVGNSTLNLAGISPDAMSSHSIVSGTAAEAGLETSNGVNAVVLKNNGGRTDTIALSRRGTAVNSGNNELLPTDEDGERLATDQRGRDFPRLIGENVDIGAYESSFANPPPTDFELSNTEVREGQPAGTTVGHFSPMGGDPGDSFTYALVAGEDDNDNASFTIDGDTLKTATVFNYQSRNVYSIFVQASDESGSSYLKSIGIYISQAPTAPVFSSMGFTDAGEFRFTLTAEVGQAILLQTSEDLVTWTALETPEPLNGIIHYIDPNSTNEPRKFYRAVIQD